MFGTCRQAVGNADERPRWYIAALYVTAHKERIVVVRVFVKKTQKTPSREIQLALKRAKEVEYYE